MDERPQSNAEVERPDLFETVNHYFLLFFAASCVISSLYIQQMFAMIGHYQAGIGVSAAVGIVLPIFLLTRRFGSGFRQQLNLIAPRSPQVVFVVLGTLCAVVIVDQIYLISQQFQPVPEYYTEVIEDIKPGNGWAFALVFAGMCVFVPLAEELVFRGYVQRIFAYNMGPVLAFVFAGLVFGAAHLNAHLLASISFFGLFLGFVYYATENLTYTVISHSLFNTVALLQLTFTDTAADLPFYLRDVRVFVIALVMLIFFLYKIKQGGSETEPPREDEVDKP